MHDTARLTGRAFFELYAEPGMKVLDVGSMDVNGTLRDYVPVGCAYTGVDAARGPNVDLVCEDHRIPSPDGAFDLVVSTSTLEHVEFFWLLFAEMARVARPGGFVYVSAPVGGNVHRHPVDCWRFYPDAGQALASWATRAGYPTTLVESFALPPAADGWSDFVAVFQRDETVKEADKLFRLSDRFPAAVHRRP